MLLFYQGHEVKVKAKPASALGGNQTLGSALSSFPQLFFSPACSQLWVLRLVFFSLKPERQKEASPQKL